MTKTAREILDGVVIKVDTAQEGELLKPIIDQALKELEAIHQQEIAKAVNKALVLQFEMDLENLSMHNSLHKLPKEYVVPRKYSLERSIETLKEHKEEL